jgi:hypothetical protein
MKYLAIKRNEVLIHATEWTNLQVKEARHKRRQMLYELTEVKYLEKANL